MRNKLLTEKTFNIDKDVVLVYNALFKNLILDIQKNGVDVLKHRLISMDSSQLVSPMARKADAVNPIRISGGIDLGDKNGNYYNPSERYIHLSLRPSIIQFWQDHSEYKTLDEIVEYISKHQRDDFRREFSPAKMKATIAHELSHWIDDSLHGSHITKMIKKSSAALKSGDWDIVDKITHRGESSIGLTDYEINAQIHAIKRLRTQYRRIWDRISLMDLIQMYSPLTAVYDKLSNSGKKRWIRKILHRMNRENLLSMRMRSGLNESFKDYIQENAQQTMTLWHGGNLSDGFIDSLSHKKGKWEYGPGLYLTTHYHTAKGYAKGNRKLYKVVIQKGSAIEDVMIDVQTVFEFIDGNVIRNRAQIIKDNLERHIKDGRVPLFILNNLIINYDGIKNTNTNELRKFLVENGADYSLVSNAFGWHEMMVVLFNMDKIVSITQVKPNDKISEYDLATEFK